MAEMRVPLNDFLADLIACVCSNVTEHGQGETCWCGLYPGEAVSWEFCGECSTGKCGMAWVRPATANPYSTFPLLALDPNCVKPLAYEIEIGILRCLPVAENDGTLPTPEVYAEATYGLMMDQMALHRAIRCCEFKDVTLGPWRPVGPQGGCVGGFWTIWVDPLFSR